MASISSKVASGVEKLMNEYFMWTVLVCGVKGTRRLACREQRLEPDGLVVDGLSDKNNIRLVR
jgi:hypothetical protein